MNVSPSLVEIRLVISEIRRRKKKKERKKEEKTAVQYKPFGIAIPKGLYFTAVFLCFFLSFFFFRRQISDVWGHWTDLNQTWTHIHLWLLFEKFVPNSPGIYPSRARGKNVFGTDFELWPNIPLQQNIISTIGKEICQSAGTHATSPNLVNFYPETAKNGWRVFAKPSKFSHFIGRHCQPYRI